MVVVCVLLIKFIVVPMPALAIYSENVATPIQECNDISCGLPCLAFSIASIPAISVLKAPN